MVFFIKLILRNILRHRLRSGLTATGIVVAIVAFGMLRTLVDAWYAGAEATSATRLVTRNAVSSSQVMKQEGLEPKSDDAGNTPRRSSI